MKFFRRFGLALAAVLPASTTAAQDLLWRAEGVGGLVNRALVLHRLGDYDGDGWDDLIELGSAWSGVQAYDAVRITSGRDGSFLSVGTPLPYQGMQWPPELWIFGNMAPLGDMDGDGTPDYGGHAYDAYAPVTTQTLVTVSGASHTILWTATTPNAWNTDFGKVLCGDLDVNGDGLPDVVTSEYSGSPGGTIIVFDNAGLERYRIVDPIPGASMGLDVASLQGDLDGDGCDDFVSTGPELGNRGAVAVFSGRTGAVLRVSYGEQPGDRLVNAGACGDIDLDGTPDYCGGGSFGAGVVTAFSGATGQIIHSWRDPNHCCMGVEVTGGFDLDSDGVPDLVTGQISSSQGANSRIVSALSGRDGSFLARWYRSANNFTCLAETAAMLGPGPGQPYASVVFAERCWGSPSNLCGVNMLCPGVVWCYSGSPPGVRPYGTPDASPGQPLARSGMRSPTPASVPTVRYTMSEAPPGALAMLMLGASNAAIQGMSLPLPLDPFGFSGVTLWTSADITLLTVAGTNGTGTGYAELNVLLPPGRVIDYSGTPFYAQWLWFDPGNFHNHGSTAGQRFRLQ